MASTLLISFTIFTFAIAQFTPGLIVSVREQALNDLKNALIPIIISNISSVSLPNFEVDHITVSNLVITQLDLAPENIILNLDNGQISVAASNMDAHFSMEFTIDLIFGAKVHKDSTGVATNAQIEASIELLYNNDTLSINTPTMNVEFESFKISLDGILGSIESWIVNLFLPWFKGEISNTVASKLQTIGVADINTLLSTIPSTMDLPFVPIGINYELDQNPVIYPNYISFLINGTFFNDLEPYQNPSIPPPTQLPTIDNSTTEDVQIFVSEYFFNGLFYALYTSEFLQYTINNSMIPQGSPIQLDTESLDFIFPGIYSYYQGNYPVQLACGTTEMPPSVIITSINLEFDLTGYCNVEVQTNAGWDQAFTLLSNLSATANASLSNFTIYADIETLTFGEVQIINSKIAGLDPDQITVVINNIGEILLPTIDQTVFGAGIPLPSVPFANLSSTEITLNEGYLKIGGTPAFDNLIISEIIRNNNMESSNSQQ